MAYHVGRVAEQAGLRHLRSMAFTPDNFERSAQIVEAFAEGEDDERVVDLLARIATAIREHAVDD
ncbi:hypothetical protein [Sphingomonas yabuuchiae]|uniref:Uncharacterized protein n=2 Tax=Sphingomonas yabuuchiae TaxID=172044 RepID=A0ABR6KE93_9SPHN|nr:hypothetical protein [Sphingomonas yabuuchiae]